MFTGIISDIGTIASVEPGGDARVVIATSAQTAEAAIGASIACSGVCLTVVDKGEGWFAVDVSGETVARTAPGQWRKGTRLNLERAMRLGDELGGHIVTGHVDGVGSITDIVEEGGSRRVSVAVANELAPFIATKGSVTVDGVSLTVNAVADLVGAGSRFTVNLIPHTQRVTTLGDAGVGAAVNIEIDVLARYLRRLQQVALPTPVTNYPYRIRESG